MRACHQRGKVVGFEKRERGWRAPIEKAAGSFHRFRLPQRLVVPPYVMDGLPEGLADTGVSFPNGQRSELSGVVIEAGPSYGTSGEAHAGIRRGAAMGTEGVDDHSR
jgi:hypothetical protein